MARKKWLIPPDEEQLARTGIDTLFFTLPGIQRNTNLILEWLQKYVSSSIYECHLTNGLGNSFYNCSVSISAYMEDYCEVRKGGEPNTYSPIINSAGEDLYKRKVTELIRVFYDPRPQGERLYKNETTNFQLKGELLKHIDVQPILKFIVDNKCSVTRLDLYKDDFDHRLNMCLLNKICEASSYTNHVQCSTIKNYQDILNGENSIYLGSKKKIQFHIYDKGRHVMEKFHHIRVELKLTRDNPYLTGIVHELVSQGNMSNQISILINSNLQFKPEGLGRIYDRDAYQWWVDFIGSTETVMRKDFVFPISDHPRPLPSCEALMRQKETLQYKLGKRQEELERLEYLIMTHPENSEF